MFFKLVHEVGNRQRWITTGTMTTASAELIADDVSVIAGFRREGQSAHGLGDCILR